ncbi:MAG: FAD-binding oxidoreductase, partial [Candidatus Hodarchaeales archaeon]
MHSEAAIRKLGKKLRKIVEGEVKWDHSSRFLWSTDGSLFQVKPSIILLPQNESDVIAAVKFSNKYGLPITPRGAGSGLGGQALGTGLIIDFQKNMQNILEINFEEGYCILEPGARFGIIQRELDKENYWIPPDPSSGNFITIGGMIGNNASGAHSGKYGHTNDYILELRVVLSDGSVIKTKACNIGGKEIARITSSDTLESAIYQKVLHICVSHEDLIAEHFPKVPVNVAGYAGLKNSVREGMIDLGQLIAGSEGTLGIITQAKLKIACKPTHTILAQAFFDSLSKAGEAVAQITSKFNPSAIELLDRSLIDIAR